MNDALLQALESRLAAGGVTVVRFNFPYRDAGRRMPGAARESEEAFREVAGAARVHGAPLFIGGKSYGGRIATHIAAAGFPCDGLVLISYPLHPPGRFDKLRTEHLPRVHPPMLFVRGTNDPFSRADLFADAMTTLSGATVHEIAGGDHSLRVKGVPAAAVADDVAGAIARFVA